MGTLTEQEHDIPLADILARSILEGYENLKLILNYKPRIGLHQ